MLGDAARGGFASKALAVENAESKERDRACAYMRGVTDHVNNIATESGNTNTERAHVS